MTGGLIFKMELYKYWQDKKNLISMSILAVLNIVITSIFAWMSEGLGEVTLVPLVMFGVLLFFVNWLFIFLVPYFILSMDYRNNVMALMIASGVNRTKLYFSKIGAIILSVLGTFLILTLIPFIIFMIRISAEINIADFINGFFEGLGYIFTDTSGVTTLFMMILSVLNVVVIMAAATIIGKGKFTSFFIYFGFNIIQQMLSTTIMTSMLLSGDPNNFSEYSILWYTVIVSIASIAIFGFIGLTVLKRQDL